MNKQQALNGVLKVKLGERELMLAIDTNCMAELEERTGENPLANDFWPSFLYNIGPKKIRLLFWAMTRSEHPDLSEQEVGRLLSLENFEGILEMLDMVQTVSLGNENTKKNSLKSRAAEKARKTTATAPSTGSSSGQQQDTASGSPTKSSEG